MTFQIVRKFGLREEDIQNTMNKTFYYHEKIMYMKLSLIYRYTPVSVPACLLDFYGTILLHFIIFELLKSPLSSHMQ